MVPSTFGNWWADEMPWFMPSLRMDILKQVAQSRSTAMPEPREIANAVKRMFNTIQTPVPKLSEREAMRLSHLRFVFETQPGQDRIEIMNTLINGKPNKPNQFVGLLEATQQDDAAAEDLHYLAVLYQKCAKPDDARKYYERALERYAGQEKNSLESKVLRLLCLMDLGILELEVMNNFRSASERFVEAGRRPGTPGPFVAFCLIKQADALRRDGLVVTADHRMDEAIRYLEIADPSQESQLTIAAHKYRAWGFMESWRFQNAKDEFDKTLQMLDHVAKVPGHSHPERVVDKFHVKHGLAMIHRFQGHDREALSAYRELTPEIWKAIERTEDSDAPGQLGEVRDLLYERLVNSLERQADCSLFGQNPDYAEAADDYRLRTRHGGVLARGRPRSLANRPKVPPRDRACTRQFGTPPHEPRSCAARAAGFSSPRRKCHAPDSSGESGGLADYLGAGDGFASAECQDGAEQGRTCRTARSNVPELRPSETE